ncbi:MAG: hypothetical protein HYW48_01350 [Deltaproteobacteria bacterium]|nr:hypothetical protein [Deltaproteobacteria bacterium]
MEETAQLVPPRNPGEATHHSPPQPPSPYLPQVATHYEEIEKSIAKYPLFL